MFLDSHGDSDGKESACNAGDPGSIPGSGSSPGEGIDYPLHCSWAPMGTQMVKNLPGVQENRVQSWGDPLEEYRVTHSRFLPRESPGTGEH